MSIVSAHTLHPQDQASDYLEQGCGLRVTFAGLDTDFAGPDMAPGLGKEAQICFQNSRGTRVKSDSCGVLMSPDMLAAIES